MLSLLYIDIDIDIDIDIHNDQEPFPHKVQIKHIGSKNFIKNKVLLRGDVDEKAISLKNWQMNKT